jgi:hypothetical protein
MEGGIDFWTILHSPAPFLKRLMVLTEKLSDGVNYLRYLIVAFTFFSLFQHNFVLQ